MARRKNTSPHSRPADDEKQTTLLQRRWYECQAFAKYLYHSSMSDIELEHFMQRVSVEIEERDSEVRDID